MRGKWQPQTTETTPDLLLQNLTNKHYWDLHESTSCAGFVWKLLTLFIKIYTRKPAIQGPHLCALNSFFVFRLPCEVLLRWKNLWFCTGALPKASACVPRESSGLKSPSSSGVGEHICPLSSLGSKLSESIVSRKLFCSYHISDFIHSPVAKSGSVYFHQRVPGSEEGFAHCINLSSDIFLKHETVSEPKTAVTYQSKAWVGGSKPFNQPADIWAIKNFRSAKHVIHSYKPSTQETEAGGLLWVQDRHWLHDKY